MAAVRPRLTRRTRRVLELCAGSGVIVERLPQNQKCVLLLVMSDRKMMTTLEFPYTRTLGPVIGAFAAGLREKRLLASRTHEGRVLFPPLEYDPETGASVESD